MSRVTIARGRVDVETDNPDTSYVVNLALHVWGETQQDEPREPIGFVNGSTLFTSIVADDEGDGEEVEAHGRRKRR